MTPALEPGDFVIAVRRHSPPRRGEVVVYETAERPGFHIVKRVVGLPGETICIDSGRVTFDGRILTEPWAQSPTTGDGEWRLGQNEVFVMGDQRHASDGDSRQIGPLPAAPRDVVVWRYWPRRRFGRLTPPRIR